MNYSKWLLAALLLPLANHGVLAEDTYFRLPITSLKFTEGTLPNSLEPPGYRNGQVSIEPYAALDGEGECFIGGEVPAPWGRRDRFYQDTLIGIRVPSGKEITGRLFVPKPDFSGMTMLRFQVANEKPVSKTDFLKIKEEHYRRLLNNDIAGGAWFRHQQTEAAKARGAKPAATDLPSNGFNRRRSFALDENFDSSYELFSGGRALSENLQLDRLLAVGRSNQALVDITSLQGITVREMDWKPLVKDIKPALDPLAACIPFDQHALFFPTFQALMHWIDEADSDGTPVLQLFEPRSEDANSRGRYQKQICLELTEVSRLLGPSVIASAAFTGSDPYLRTGTDIGVLYETRSAAVLKAFIAARQAAAQQTNTAVEAVKGEFEGVPYSGVRSADRSISSYVAALDEVVLVSNSPDQLAAMLAVAKGKKPALASQDEYLYFRNKYPKSEKNETGFLVLSDATIRRWCGPKWRIANARRTHAAALMAEFQAAHLDDLVRGKASNTVETNLPDLGALRITPAGVLSSTYGTLEFLTPIIEMPMAKVTQAEADAYNRWRNGYQQNWNQFFDPIAVRFSMSPQQLGAELTVMPLIAGTEYRQFIGLTRGAKINADAGDRHPESMLHLAMSLNTGSELVKESGNFLGGFSPSLKANPLGWLGQSVAVYADQDPFWDDLRRAERPSNFMETNYPRLPLALHCEVKSALGVTAFLATVRGFIEQTAPNMTSWQSLEYNGQAYVKVLATQRESEGMVTNLAVYYAVTPKSLLVTLNEAVLKRALDRQGTNRPAQVAKSADLKPWLGDNLCLQLNSQVPPALDAIFRDEYRSAQQVLAWNNLPILNEWKRLYPDRDPVKLHEQWWQTKLLCPGGGTYVWNEKWQTMESTVYGHPGEPKEGPRTILPLTKIKSVNLGLTFEDQGLSARVVLDRAAGKP